MEISLRIFDYGEDLSMWVPATKGKKIINANVARRYFSNVKNIPTTIEDVFDSSKANNGYRVFVLGESSAAGYPFMPLGSFSRYIRKRLELTYPEKRIEVINIGLTAVNSYTVRDFIPEVLEEKPDLILIYTGHNEFYGALGVGSLETMGNSRPLVNTYLFLSKFKTVQLMKDLLQWVAALFSSDDEIKKTGTLMARMAKEQSIVHNSETFKNGIDQFSGNMRDILQMIRSANVPVIIGTLTSNIKDQTPFISTKDQSGKSAMDYFHSAQEYSTQNNFVLAKKNFIKAKDLDALRFRAPSEINQIIKNLGKEFNIPVADVDSLFCKVSNNGITGNELMTDHLHPTLQGYQLMGKLFYDKMLKNNFIPGNISKNNEHVDSLTIASYPFSKLDSSIASYRIKILKNDWPFVNPTEKKVLSKLVSPKNFSDSLAYKVLDEQISWADAHEQLAQKYFRQTNYNEFIRHIEILIYQYPIITEYYVILQNAALKLLQQKKYDYAYKILMKHYNLSANAFCTKWIGNILLNEGKATEAIKYLEESIGYSESDLQTYYNLSGAYALNKQYEKAYQTINLVIAKDKDYPGAYELQNQLRLAMNK